MRYSILALAMMLPTTALALDSGLQDSLEKAKATKDSFIIEAVKNQAIAAHPEQEADIIAFLQKAPKPAPAPVKVAAKKAEREKGITLPYVGLVTGSTELGANFESGNTDAQDLNAKLKLKKTYGKYEHTFTAKAKISEEDDVTTDEEYEADFNSRYNWSDVDYLFGELEYINDRFGGFEYRTSELVGYGRKLYNDDIMNWEAEIGAGLQQTNPTVGSNENSWLVRGTTRYDWQITDGWDFETELTSSLSKDNIFTEWDSGLKTALMENLFLKFGVNVDHTSDVPAGTKHIDTQSMVNVVYEF